MDGLTILCDSREKTPLTFSNLPSKKSSLYTGDYTIEGLEERFVVERKTLQDLVGSLSTNRDRFFRELHRMRGSSFRRLLIVASPSAIELKGYRGKMAPRSVWASLCAIQARYDIPFVFESDPSKASLLVEQWAFWFYRESLRHTKNVPPTPSWAVPSVH